MAFTHYLSKTWFDHTKDGNNHIVSCFLIKLLNLLHQSYYQSNTFKMLYKNIIIEINLKKFKTLFRKKNKSKRFFFVTHLPPVLFTLSLGVNGIYLRIKIKKHQSKNTYNLKCYKIHWLFRLYSILLLLWACVTGFGILLITYKKRGTFFTSSCDCTSFTNPKFQGKKVLLDGMRCIWTIAVWLPFVNGGSRGTAS